MLEALGHEVDIASDGQSAIDAVQRKDYDLVLMDIQMPGMDGLTAIRKIRALSTPAASIPIIALTANVLSADVARCKEAGANGHIGKPFTFDGLGRAISQILPPSFRRGSVALNNGQKASPSAFDDEKQDAHATNFVGSIPKSDAPPPRLRQSVLARAEEFLQSVVAVLAALDQKAADPGQLQPLRDTAHKLRGSAGAFGFDEIGKAAGRVEDAIERAANRHGSAASFESELRSSLSSAVAAVDVALTTQQA